MCFCKEKDLGRSLQLFTVTISGEAGRIRESSDEGKFKAFQVLFPSFIRKMDSCMAFIIIFGGHSTIRRS